MRRFNAFSLAELLVSMSVLSIIATFNISKILTVHDFNIQKAKLKTTVSTLQNLGLTAYQSGVKDSDGWIEYLKTHLNHSTFQNSACTDVLRHVPYGDENYACFKTQDGVGLNISTNTNPYSGGGAAMTFVTTDPNRYSQGGVPFNRLGLYLNLTNATILGAGGIWGSFLPGEMHPPYDWSMVGCPIAPNDRSCIPPDSEWAQLFRN